jgi:uncharacterized protein (DUF433 family)
LSAAAPFTDPHGDIRVRGTRVTLDTIVTAFSAGAMAEEIAQKFPTVPLADVYQIIAYYLNHTTQIDAFSCLSAKPPPPPLNPRSKSASIRRRSRSPAGAS